MDMDNTVWLRSEESKRHITKHPINKRTYKTNFSLGHFINLWSHRTTGRHSSLVLNRKQLEWNKFCHIQICFVREQCFCGEADSESERDNQTTICTITSCKSFLFMTSLGLFVVMFVIILCRRFPPHGRDCVTRFLKSIVYWSAVGWADFVNRNWTSCL